MDLKNVKISYEKVFRIVYIIGIFIFFFLWAYVQPYDASPDEDMRFQIPNYIYKFGKLPHGGNPVIRNTMWGTSYGFTPILSYIISAGFMKLTSLFTLDKFTLVMSARMVSVIFGTLTVWLTMKISDKLFNKEYQKVFILLVTTLPQFVFINSYVNTDAIAMFSVAFIIYMWITAWEDNWSYKSCILLGIAISFCAQSYYNAYGFILCSVFIYIIYYAFFADKDVRWKEFFKKGLVIIGVVFICTGWWFIRNYIIYDGDILGLKTCNYYGELYGIDELKPSKILTPKREGESIWGMLKGGWIESTFISFIGVFGHMDIVIPYKIYYFYVLIFAAGFTGCLFRVMELFAIRKNGEWIKTGFFNWIMLISGIIPILISIYYSYTSDYQPQGRYVMPMLFSLMYFTTLGIEKWLGFFKKYKCFCRIVRFTFCVILVGIVLFCFFKVFMPYYR